MHLLSKTIGAFSLFFAHTLAFSLPIFTDTFTYPNGDLVGQGGWAAHSGAASTPVQVSSGSIVLTQGAGSREDVNLKIGTPLTTGETIFASFDVTVSGGNTTVYFAHFIRGTTIFDTRLFISPLSGSDFVFGIGSGASATANWASGQSFDVRYNIILSYEFDTGVSKMWINATDESQTSVTFTGISSSAVEGFAFRQAAGNSTQVIDNLKVAGSFSAVAIPEPSTYTALAGAMALSMVLLRRRRRASVTA